MNKNKRLALGLVIALGSFYYTIQNLSYQELMNSILKVNNSYLFVTFIIMTFCYVPRAFRWQLLLSPIKIVKTFELINPMMIGFMGNFLPGRVGEFLRAYLFGKKFGVSIVSSFATIVVERFFDLIVVIMLFTWIMVFHHNVFESEVYLVNVSLNNLSKNFGTIALIVVFSLIISLYLLIFKNDKTFSIIRYIVQIFPKKLQFQITEIFRRFSLGLEALKDPISLIKIIILTMIIWTFTILAFYPLALAFEIQEKSIALLVLLRAMVSIFIVILPTPAYLGSFNAGIFVVLHEIFGESEIIAASFGLVAWTLNTLVVFISCVMLVCYEWIKEHSYNSKL